ncbi:hypothetical protein BC629DRAFT_1439646 [Irpex lacteus]|nr:hypothetical protein BC629DRAFT_1439646 [Irpex lacteus]
MTRSPVAVRDAFWTLEEALLNLPANAPHFTSIALTRFTSSKICFVQGQNTTLEISTPKNVTQCMYTEISRVGGTDTTLKLFMYDADISMPSVSSNDFTVQDSGISFTSGSSTLGTAPHAAPVPQTTSDVRHHLPNGAIGGMIAGGVLLLVASATVLLMRTKWLRRWNKFTASRSQHPSTGDHNQDETKGSESLSNACSPSLGESKNGRTQDRAALEGVVSTSESAPQPPEEIVHTVRSDPAATPASDIEPAEHHDRDVGVVHGNRPYIVSRNCRTDYQGCSI